MIDKEEAKKMGCNTITTSETLTDAQQERIEKIKALLPNVVNVDNKIDTKPLQDLCDISNTTSNNQGYKLTFVNKSTIEKYH